tara:strand:+ start:1008 stop:1487 length:480 start_codon:yes stop_codon:yes gene_type:complete
MLRVPTNYIPKSLSRKNKKLQRSELKKSRKAYRKKQYYTRKKLPGYKSRRTRWAKRASKIYNVPDMKDVGMSELSSLTKCSVKSLNNIIKKGVGAYYSAGSRPNQTAHSWGIARLYSAISGGPASKVDMHLLKEGCKKNSRALRLAKKEKRKAAVVVSK